MALPILGSAVSLVGDLAGSWLKGRVAKQQAETEAKVAQAKAKAVVYEKQATGELDMERSLTEQMGGSWKDEAWTIFFIAVLTACFLPWTQEYVKEGFIFLDEHTPTWFHNMLYIVIGSSFGYRFGKQGLQILNRKK